jgi:hypothetical protein
VPTGDFKLNNSPNLCHLNADSAGVTAQCDQTPASNQCPYPACGCKWLQGCASGAAFNTPAVAANTVNAASPYYPNEATCCAAGNTIRELMVTDLYLDCSTAPCTATAKGLSQVSILYVNNPAITGTMPPQIAALTAVTLLYVYNNDEMSGTLPTQLGLMTLVKDAYLYGHAKLSGTIPPQISGMTNVTRLYVYCYGEGFAYDLCV